MLTKEEIDQLLSEFHYVPAWIASRPMTMEEARAALRLRVAAVAEYQDWKKLH
jgi:hypothetical protein